MIKDWQIASAAALVVGVVAIVLTPLSRDDHAGKRVVESSRIESSQTASLSVPDEDSVFPSGGGAPSTAKGSRPLPVALKFHEPVPLPGEVPIRVPILMYHHIRKIVPSLTRSEVITSVSPANFERQMKEVADAGYTTITPNELRAAIKYKVSLPRKPVLITFDDGYRNQYDAAFPILKKYGLKATFFVITDYGSKSGYLTDAMIQELDASGIITIASHTRHHAWLTAVGRATEIDEIEGSKQYLERLLGHPVPAFAYPYGSLNAKAVDLVKDAGYSIGFSAQAGSLHMPSTLLKLRRIRVLNSENVVTLLKRVMGGS